MSNIQIVNLIVPGIYGWVSPCAPPPPGTTAMDIGIEHSSSSCRRDCLLAMDRNKIIDFFYYQQFNIIGTSTSSSSGG